MLSSDNKILTERLLGCNIKYNLERCSGCEYILYTTPTAGIQHINATLLNIKSTIHENDGKNFIFKNREKNKETLLKLGLFPSHVKEEISNLTYKDYCSGPEQNLSDHGERKGTIWVFGRKINNIDIYIKLHVIPLKETQCICVSFHEAENELKFPYR